MVHVIRDPAAQSRPAVQLICAADRGARRFNAANCELLVRRVAIFSVAINWLRQDEDRRAASRSVRAL